MKLKTFKVMSDEEKLAFISENLIKAIDFRKEMEGTGRTYDTSIRLSIEQLEWLVSKAE